MLIQFRIENHRSIRDEQTLSLVAAGNGLVDDHLLRPDGLGDALLPAVALYGANASGKTNVVLALEFMRDAVVNSHRLWEPRSGVPQEPFALAGPKHSSSLFEVDLLMHGVRYRYGFTIDSKRIKKEWLYAWPNGRKQSWFERQDDTFLFGRNFRGENETIRGLTRSNSLFLSASGQNNHSMLLPIYGWFQELIFEIRRSKRFSIWPFTSRFVPLDQLFDNAFSTESFLFPDEATAFEHDREAIVQLLRAADTGIVDLRIDREAPDDQRGRSAGLAGLYFQHQADDPDRAWLPVEVESAGTVTLLGLARRWVPTLRNGGVLCVDEIESSLHPMLAGGLLQLFCDRERNPHGAQLIFTTHDTNLLGNVLGAAHLRRDQIWFTEKDNSGASHLYPLTDFHPRKEENLERGYLQGRYGAIPFLGDLLPDTTAPVGS